MDTTKKNLEMCKKAKEIQKRWKPKIGDCIGGEWFIDQNDTMGLCYKGIIFRFSPEGRDDCVDTGGSIYWLLSSHFWIPRQDQLQEIILKDELSVFDLSRRFNDFCDFRGKREINKYTTYCNSMEQLWLAFVMKEKYNKIWNEEKWIKDKKHLN